MKRKTKNGKDPLEGLIEWASPTDKVYSIGLVAGGVPVSAVRRKKRGVRKRLKDRPTAKRKKR